MLKATKLHLLSSSYLLIGSCVLLSCAVVGAVVVGRVPVVCVLLFRSLMGCCSGFRIVCAGRYPD